MCSVIGKVVCLLLIFFVAGCGTTRSRSISEVAESSALATAVAPAVSLVGPPVLLSYVAEGSPPLYRGELAPAVDGEAVNVVAVYGNVLDYNGRITLFEHEPFGMSGSGFEQYALEAEGVYIDDVEVRFHMDCEFSFPVSLHDYFEHSRFCDGSAAGNNESVVSVTVGYGESNLVKGEQQLELLAQSSIEQLQSVWKAAGNEVPLFYWESGQVFIFRDGDVIEIWSVPQAKALSPRFFLQTGDVVVVMVDAVF